MTLNRNADQYEMAHEFGHVLGLVDWYRADWTTLWEPRPMRGFGNDIMGNKYASVHAWDIAVLSTHYQ